MLLSRCDCETHIVSGVSNEASAVQSIVSQTQPCQNDGGISETVGIV